MAVDWQFGDIMFLALLDFIYLKAWPQAIYNYEKN